MKTIFLSLLLVLSLLGCKKKDDTNTDKDLPDEAFDKQALLINIADNVILPNYTRFESDLNMLNATFQAYSNAPTLAGLDSVKIKFQAAYKSYQHISLYEFGPAEQVVVRNNFNVFPTDTTQINSNIASGSYDLNMVSQLDAKGLPSLDFLFFGRNNSTAAVHALFASSANRRNYVKQVILDMKFKADAVIAGWAAYRTTFVSSLGTDVSSSIGYLINQLNFELDYVKNAKIGIPLGKKTLGIAVPNNCEAYYSGNSLEYAIESVKAIESLYLGKSTEGIDDKGFDDYLNHLKIQRGSEALTSAITKQFAVAFSKLNAIASPLSQQVLSNPSHVDAAYVELVKLLVLLKTDMPSSLGVVITYQDGDGD
ncbi:MAG: imelysin family protein [Bacteroidia bacterium]|jgi:hypothetical protein|nr:imelysin family protein [Bacteroidia bacterium]